MSRFWTGLVVAGAAVVVGSVSPAPVALGEVPTWEGPYAVTFGADEKTGTSEAATQWQNAYTENFVFSSTCSADRCITTVLGGPAPSNPTVPEPLQYTWNGSAWQLINDWQFNCQLPDGSTEWSPASARVTYTPQSDGTFYGEWETVIHSGACEGTLNMPLLAVPA